jgi:hypothetical protein
MINGYDNKLKEPAKIPTAARKAKLKDRTNCDGVARLTILLGLESKLHVEYKVVDDAKTLLEKLASAYRSKLKLTIFEIRDDHWRIKLHDCGDVDNYALPIDWKVKD